MRYYIKGQTLVVRGAFDGLSTGMNGGRRKVGAVVNHHVGKDFNEPDPQAYLDAAARAAGAEAPYFGFMTAVDMKNLCIVRDPFVTAFVTAGISNQCHDPGVPGTINILLFIHGNLSEGALASAVITATEAKTKALFEMGFDFTGTTTDAVAVLSAVRDTGLSEPAFYQYSGTATPIGQSIYRCVKKGVTEGIKRQHNVDGISHKSRLFVLAQRDDDSTYWIGHPPESEARCPYYPCHFEGQACNFCFCPLYPCEDKELGEWIMTTRGYPVWTCKDCTLLHQPEVAEHLAGHPDAPLGDLKAINVKPVPLQGADRNR